MKKRLLAFYFLLFISYCSFSKSAGIGTSSSKASTALDITHTAKGSLIPGMNTAALKSIANSARRLLMYDSLTNQLMVNIGLYVAPQWEPVAGSGNVQEQQ